MRTKSGAANQLIPFAVILILAMVAVGAYACYSVSNTSKSAASNKAQAITKTLAAVLGDPFSMGEYDHMQKILEAAAKADGDIVYAVVVTPDGKAVATTDPALKDLNLTRNEFEKDALKATDYQQRQAPDAHNFESVMPIKTISGSPGFVRIGTSRTRTESEQTQVLTILAVICLASLVVGVGIFAAVSKGGSAPPSA